MKKNIFENSEKENKIFKDERYLYEDYVPEILPHRESEINEMVYSLKPILKGQKPQNIFIHGKSGTGKTVTTKHVMGELEEYSDRAKSKYINCFEKNTRHSILTTITNFLGYPTPRRGLGSDEIIEKMVQALKNNEFLPIIILDEVDQLLKKDEASKLFYDLLRITQHKVRIGIVFISNDSEFILKLDDRVKSSLNPEKIEFQTYGPTELKNILRERCKYAIYDNAIVEETIGLAAAHAAKLGGDARVAIESMLRAGRQAERENSSKIQPKHLLEIFETIDDSYARRSLTYLTEQEQKIMKIISEKENINSGEIYEKYNEIEENPQTDRTVRMILKKLEEYKLIESEFTQKENKGRTKKYKLKIDKKLIIK